MVRFACRQSGVQDAVIWRKQRYRPPDSNIRIHMCSVHRQRNGTYQNYRSWWLGFLCYRKCKPCKEQRSMQRVELHKLYYSCINQHAFVVHNLNLSLFYYIHYNVSINKYSFDTSAYISKKMLYLGISWVTNMVYSAINLVLKRSYNQVTVTKSLMVSFIISLGLLVLKKLM